MSKEIAFAMLGLGAVYLLAGARGRLPTPAGGTTIVSLPATGGTPAGVAPLLQPSLSTPPIVSNINVSLRSPIGVATDPVDAAMTAAANAVDAAVGDNGVNDVVDVVDRVRNFIGSGLSQRAANKGFLGSVWKKPTIVPKVLPDIDLYALPTSIFMLDEDNAIGGSAVGGVVDRVRNFIRPTSIFTLDEDWAIGGSAVGGVVDRVRNFIRPTSIFTLDEDWAIGGSAVGGDLGLGALRERTQEAVRGLNPLNRVRDAIGDFLGRIPVFLPSPAGVLPLPGVTIGGILEFMGGSEN